MFTVYNVGMIFFDNCDKGVVRRALIPDGRKGGKNTPPHYASIFVAADKVDLENTRWWGWGGRFEREVTFTQNEHHTHVRVYEFRINAPSELWFPEKRNSEVLLTDADKLQQPNRDFEPANDPKTIARMVLRGGKLEACSLGSVPIVRWTVEEHADPIRITARDDAGTHYTIALKDSKTLANLGIAVTDPVEIVLANTPDIALLEGIAKFEKDPNVPHHDQNGKGTKDDGDRKRGKKSLTNGTKSATNGSVDNAHAIVYSMLDQQRNAVRLIGGNAAKLPQVVMKRGLVEYLASSKAYQAGHCTPTCCKTGGG